MNFVGLTRSATAMNRYALQRSLFSQRAVARTISIVKFNEKQELEQLNEFRNKRTMSPDLQIYAPQLTSGTSTAHRLTGAVMTASIYGYFLSYGLSLPQLLFGVPFDGAAMVHFIETLPPLAFYGFKTLLAAPFSFHFWNGIRHLAWDNLFVLDLKTCYNAGYAVLAATALSTIGLVFFV